MQKKPPNEREGQESSPSGGGGGVITAQGSSQSINAVMIPTGDLEFTGLALDVLVSNVLIDIPKIELTFTGRSSTAIIDGPCRVTPLTGNIGFVSLPFPRDLSEDRSFVVPEDDTRVMFISGEERFFDVMAEDRGFTVPEHNRYWVIQPEEVS